MRRGQLAAAGLLAVTTMIMTGTASVGTGVPVTDTALTYVPDVSGSTASACGTGNTMLGCESLTARTLNGESAAADSLIGSVGAVAFGSQAATADLGPAAAGIQSATTATSAQAHHPKTVVFVRARSR